MTDKPTWIVDPIGKSFLVRHLDSIITTVSLPLSLPLLIHVIITLFSFALPIPKDGTTNFVHGYPFVCVSIALVETQRSVLGVIYNPILDEVSNLPLPTSPFPLSHFLLTSILSSLSSSHLALHGNHR